MAANEELMDCERAEAKAETALAKWSYPPELIGKGVPNSIGVWFGEQLVSVPVTQSGSYMRITVHKSTGSTVKTESKAA